MVKVKLIIFLVFAAVQLEAATNWYTLKINQGGQVDPAGTNLFRTNIIAGTGISISVGTNGELTINGGASSTNFQGIVVTNTLKTSNLVVTGTQTNAKTLDVTGNISTFGDYYSFNFAGNALLYSDPVTHKVVESGNSPQSISDLQTATNTLTLALIAATNALVTSSNNLQTQLTAATNALNTTSNALRVSLGTTNAYILANGGLGTNNQMFSPTNTAQASNQVAVTVQGLAGQRTNLIQFEQPAGTIAYAAHPLGLRMKINGANSSPWLSWSDTTNYGFFSAGGALGIANNGASAFTFGWNAGSILEMQTAGGLAWAPAAVATAQHDTFIYKVSPGTVGLTNLMVGTSASNPTLLATNGNVGIGTTTPAAKLDVVGTSQIPTNIAAYYTTSNPTNQYIVDTLYTNLPQRSLLVGSSVLNGGVSGSANITLKYTNNAVGYQLPMQTGAGLATTDIFPFCVPLSTNATFVFVSTMGTGATGSLTNVVLWQQ